MKVPNNYDAFISEEKIRCYLLSNSHPVGKTKAAFFNKIGYNLERIDLLINELLKIVHENKIDKVIDTFYGNKYLVNGNIGLVFEKDVSIITVWIIEKDGSVPRFVTAYPSHKGE